jgi:hypothetical protein
MIYNFKNNFVEILQDLFKNKYNYMDELKYFHKILDLDVLSDLDKQSNKVLKEIGKDRNSIFLKDFHNFIDNNKSFNEVYYKFITEYIKPLFTNTSEDKLIVQKTPNLRISFPNLTAIGKFSYETGSVIGLHKDSDFGHHEEEINIIIPLTNMFDSNSLYYEPTPDSKISTNDYLNLNVNTNEFFVEKLNKLLHFNKINDTGLTRLSLDLRIIPYDKYMKNIDVFTNTKFELGKYYIVL